MALERLNHTGAAPSTGLASSITAVSTSCSVVSAAGYPAADFFIKIDEGTTSEEKILVASVSGNTFTFAVGGRGQDGTSATSHSAAPGNVEHCFTAAEADDANSHIYTTGRDDHSQYARTDGSRPVTGTQQFAAGFTVTSGTATFDGPIDAADGATFTSGDLAVSAGKVTASGVVQGSVHAATLAGAGRYVGASNGAPTSGTYVAGDFVNDPTHNTIQQCTAGGTPGTWEATMPAGAVLDHAGSAAPAGWLICDGSAVSRSTYAALFAAIGTGWGSGDGSTTFNVPDLRGRTSVGAGAAPGLTARSLAAAGGEETHALSGAELAAHNHGISDPGHNHVDPGHAHGVTDPGHNHSANVYWGGTNGGDGRFSAAQTNGTGATTEQVGTNNNTTSISVNGAFTGIQAAGTGVTTQNAGSGSGHNNMQPFAVLNKIIKT